MTAARPARAARPQRQAGAALWALAAALAVGTGSAADGAIRVVDDAGHPVQLAAPAQRIVALGPHLTEQLYAIGAGELIVGTTDFADYPPQAADIPRVARAHSVDVERIARLRPDLIVLWGSGFPPSVQQTLRHLRTPIFVSEPGTLESIASSLERLGTLTGHAAAAGAEAQRLRRRLAVLQSAYATRAPLRVFYQVWPQPLMTLSQRHAIDEAIRLCGGRNVFAALPALVPQVSVEAVLAADPQLIVAATPGGRPSDALDLWRRLPSLTAVRTNRLVFLDADRIDRHTPRMIDEIERLCEHIEDARRLLAR